MPIICRDWLFAPTPTAVANLAAEGIRDGVVEVGDLMQDLAARVSADLRDPKVLGPIGAAIGTRLDAGGYVFATVHRAENRLTSALAAWSAILGDVAGRLPVVLALHPGTAVALREAGVSLPGGVVVVRPQGYRSTLALQLHAAAVITDSGGVQREAAWLGTPCLVLRSRTEWVEAVAGSAGRMAIVGLDRARAAAEIARLVPEDAAGIAHARARELDLPPAGAAEAITRSLDAERFAR